MAFILSFFMKPEDISYNYCFLHPAITDAALYFIKGMGETR